MFRETSKFERNLFDHPIYSPELVPTDFHLLIDLKNHTRGHRSDDEVKQGMKLALKIS